MNLILHSEYRTIEYLLWNFSNKLNNPIAKALQDTPFDVEVKIISTDSRNLLMNITLPHIDWFLKQPVNIEGVRTVKNEQKFYSIIQKNEQLNIHVPQFVFYDNIYDVLILNTIKEHRSLSVLLETKRESEALNDLVDIFKEIGRILASFHNTKLLNLSVGFPPNIPLIKAGSKEFLPQNVINHDELQINSALYSHFFHPYPKRIIEELNNYWEDISVIHFDFRPDNILTNEDNKSVFFIDWEMASIGDSLWDVVVFFNQIPLKLTLKYDLSDLEIYKKEVIILNKAFFDEYLNNRNLKKTDEMIAKLKVFWKAIYLRNFISNGISFEKEIDELVNAL